MTDASVEWLMAGDPAIRWQVMRDLLGASDAECAAERARIESEGWGARLLSLRDADGQWAGGAFFPSDFGGQEEFAQIGQPWVATSWSLTQLREFGLDPSSERVRQAVALIGAHCRWDHAGQPFWAGEVEECINGRTLADGAYYGIDVSGILALLVSQRQSDGGWNCERENGATVSSYHSTINVLEGLLQYETVNGSTPELRAAREAGEEYLLTRSLFKRLSTGAPADEQFLTFTYPCRWYYDLLRGLDYLRAAATVTGAPPDPRLREALDLLHARRGADGRWNLDWQPGGRTWFPLDEGVGRPSRWITLRALRVLAWAQSAN